MGEEVGDVHVQKDLEPAEVRRCEVASFVLCLQQDPNDLSQDRRPRAGDGRTVVEAEDIDRGPPVGSQPQILP